MRWVLLVFLMSGLGYAQLGSEDALAISSQGVLIQKYRLELIAKNVANAFTLRTETGLPYAKQYPIIRSQGNDVWVDGIAESQQPFGKAFDPSHPFSDKYGFVYIPNVSISEEMIDLSYTNVLYEANTTVFKSARNTFQSTLEILK